ncbi:myosin-11 isoform X2 [Neltuma alba]|uniref:myosin-11 isoform X2 n=1 Tax=Neltuma alba TaxID=207710 RepID=UPI0010A2CF6D|nr:myosin-11-like isoform X2 [Prosopis alba]
MAVEDQSPVTPAPIPTRGDKVSETGSCHLATAPSPGNPNTSDTSPTKPASPKDFIISVASKIASQPLQNFDPSVWGVLTAISNNARKRQQGINILLTANEHCIGRVVEDMRFQIDSPAVSAKHCMLYRTEGTNEKMESVASIWLKDTSTNGTYLNWERLKKNSTAVKVCHGDIISFAAPPQHEVAFAFVFREVLKSASSLDNGAAKRKAEEFVSENKRLKGLGIGAPEGPISLDDFRRLQRSNTELRKQLEDQLVLIETLRNKNRAAVEQHGSELKSVRESVEKSYLDQLKELQQMVDLKQKEVGEINRVSAEQKHAVEDLNERLNASMQSCNEANAIISSQKVNIAELEEQLHEEQSQRKEEREKAAADLKAAVHRVQSEAQEELKRFSDDALRRERELQESMKKLQELERERCLLVETLRSKLEDTRQKVVVSDNKVRQLETQVHDEQLASANHIKRVEELEQETRRLKKELQSEKAAREEAWAKVSVLELEMNAAARDLDFERRRFKAAREKLMLRETQLRAFYSTTEEIQVLFAKQQEQLKAMQRTLEDEENYENASIDMDVVIGGNSGQGNEVAAYHAKSSAKAGSTSSAQKHIGDQAETSSNEASVTEKHDCDVRSEDCQNTQEAEFTSADHDHGAKDGFGSDIDGGGTLKEGDAVDTERVLETQSPANYNEQKVDLNKDPALVGETMQFDDDMNVQDTEEQGQTTCREVHVDTQKTIVEDTEAGGTIRTADLLASEVAGSWACSTAPSVHGENDSQRSRDNNEGAGDDSIHPVAESQSTPDAAATKWNSELRALSEMIGIVAPDLREQFEGSVNDCDQQRGKGGTRPDSDTQAAETLTMMLKSKSGSASDAETRGNDHVEEDGDSEATQDNNPMDEDSEATQDDPLG